MSTHNIRPSRYLTPEGDYRPKPAYRRPNSDHRRIPSYRQRRQR